MHESEYITENDIFNYVFFRYLLKQEKIHSIEQNSMYVENVEFYTNLKKRFIRDIPQEIKKRISDKIAQYRPINKVLLTLIKEESVKKKKDFLVLAADSPKEEPRISSRTFVNEENGYLIKLINLRNSERIFVFSAFEKVLRNYKIILHPSGKSFFQSDNSIPLEIDYKIEVDNIELEFE